MRLNFNSILSCKRSLLTLLTIASATLASEASAQTSASLQFIPDTLDYGTIRETDGEATRKVKAVNVTTDTTFIISARTSCGCTEINYSSDPIAPGDTTTFSVTYDATNRPGKFLKTIKLYTGKERTPNTLKINGMVIPSKKHLDKTYPEKAGSLRLSTLIINCGEMRENETRPCFVGIYNDSDIPLALNGDSDNDALEVRILPDTIEPHSIATATLRVSTKGISKDEFNYNAYIIDAESGKQIVKIPVGGTIRKASASKK